MELNHQDLKNLMGLLEHTVEALVVIANELADLNENVRVIGQHQGVPFDPEA